MSVSLLKEQFLEVCLDVANEYNEAVADSDQRLQWEIGALEECYKRAEVTADLFKMENGINYYREAGQYCYWIRKLKPFFMPGNSSPLVNEYISFWVATEVINFSQDKVHADLTAINPSAAIICRQEAEQNYERVLRLERKIANSLRYYVHSSGSIPILLESLFTITADADFA